VGILANVFLSRFVSFRLRYPKQEFIETGAFHGSGCSPVLQSSAGFSIIWPFGHISRNWRDRLDCLEHPMSLVDAVQNHGGPRTFQITLRLGLRGNTLGSVEAHLVGRQLGPYQTVESPSSSIVVGALVQASTTLLLTAQPRWPAPARRPPVARPERASGIEQAGNQTHA